MEDKFEDLRIAQEVALLHADLATSVPESYTTSEIAQILEELKTGSSAIDEAIRRDFTLLPLEAQTKLLAKLQADPTMPSDYWEKLLH